MKEKLVSLLNHSYSPYSHFRVAAIVVMKDGREFNGVNVENASYGATICAERSAICLLLVQDIQKVTLKNYMSCVTMKRLACHVLFVEWLLQNFLIRKIELFV